MPDTTHWPTEAFMAYREEKKRAEKAEALVAEQYELLYGKNGFIKEGRDAWDECSDLAATIAQMGKKRVEEDSALKLALLDAVSIWLLKKHHLLIDEELMGKFGQLEKFK